MSNTLLERLLKQHKDIGAAWPLFLFVISHIEDNSTVTYSELSKILNSPVQTIKTWRGNLVKEGILKTHSKKHGVIFELPDTWKEEKKPDENNNIMPAIIDLAQEVGKLKLQIAENHN